MFLKLDSNQFSTVQESPTQSSSLSSMVWATMRNAALKCDNTKTKRWRHSSHSVLSCKKDCTAKCREIETLIFVQTGERRGM